MATKKLGTLIREARTDAGLTQEQLAKKVKGASASDISKAERGEKELTQDQLKQIAKATGVTQKSLLEAAKSGKKTGSSSSSSSSSSSAAKTSMKVTATEKKLVEAYRKADSEAKKTAMKILKGQGGESVVEGLLSSALSALTGGKREMPEGEDTIELPVEE